MKEFVELVQQMREAQKKYFKFRDQTALRLSKSLECQVDQEVEKILNPDKNNFAANQTSMFDV